jgi:tetratricopeptide (TPR) repeat protein
VTPLAGAILIAAQQLAVTARLDRAEVPVGGTVVLTIEVSAEGNAPVTIEEPSAPGLTLVGRREQSRVEVEGGVPRRVTMRELTFQAQRPGLYVIEAPRVRQQAETATASPLTLRVTGTADSLVAGLDPPVRRLLQALPPPLEAPDEPVVSVAVSRDTAVPGQQVDVVTVAWIPRDVQQRLRGLPTLEEPEIRGAWTYHRPTPPGVALSRSLGGETYDLHVLHAAVFPLAAGTVEVGPARLTYELPVTGSILARALRQERRSEPASLTVVPPPDRRAPVGYRGAVASGLEIVVAQPDSELGVGEAASVAVELAGRGNPALWPEPEIEWPRALTAYPQGVSVTIDVADGILGGTRTFEYLVVADSAGTHRVAAEPYAYFDPDAGRFFAVEVRPLTFVTPSGARRAPPIVAPPPLTAGGDAPWALRVVGSIPRGAWPVVLLLPPILALAVRRWPRRRRDRPLPMGGDPSRLLHDFRLTLDLLVPGAADLPPDALTDALRAAGVESPLAGHAGRIRDRLRQSLYGPEGSPDADELAAEVEEVLRALGHAARPAGWIAGVLLILSLAPPLEAQSAERLYEAQAWRAAVDSFAARAEREPDVASHWLNLGSAALQQGDVARARTAWIRAARLAPRDPVVRQVLWSDVAGLDPLSAKIVGRQWATPAELWLAAAAFWCFGWLAWSFRLRGRVSAILVVLSLIAGGLGAWVHREAGRPIAIAAQSGTPVREAPYGPAAVRGDLDAGWAVEVRRTIGAWQLVRRGALVGWVRATELRAL